MPSIRVYCDLLARQHTLLDTRYDALPKCLEGGPVFVIIGKVWPVKRVVVAQMEC